MDINLDHSFLKTLFEKIKPNHTALIVVDMQKEFCETSELSTRLEIDSQVIMTSISSMKKLIDQAHKHGVLVIYTQEIDDPKYMTEPMWEQLNRKQMKPYCLSGTKGIEIIKEFKLIPDDEIVIKHRFSAFYNTDLDILLKTKKIKTCVFIGTQTNVCVDSTARDAYFSGYYVVVVDNCTFTYDPIVHKTALSTINEAFGVVANSDEIIKCWQDYDEP